MHIANHHHKATETSIHPRTVRRVKIKCCVYTVYNLTVNPWDLVRTKRRDVLAAERNVFIFTTVCLQKSSWLNVSFQEQSMGDRAKQTSPFVFFGRTTYKKGLLLFGVYVVSRESKRLSALRMGFHVSKFIILCLPTEKKHKKLFVGRIRRFDGDDNKSADTPMCAANVLTTKRLSHHVLRSIISQAKTVLFK